MRLESPDIEGDTPEGSRIRLPMAPAESLLKELPPRSIDSLRRPLKFGLPELPPTGALDRSRGSLRKADRPLNDDPPEPPLAAGAPLRSRNPPENPDRLGDASNERRTDSEPPPDARGALADDRLPPDGPREPSFEPRGSRAQPTVALSSTAAVRPVIQPEKHQRCGMIASPAYFFPTPHDEQVTSS